MSKNEKSYIGILYIDDKYEIRTVDNHNLALYRQRIDGNAVSFEIGEFIYMKCNIRKVFIGDNSGREEEFSSKEDFEKAFCNLMKRTKSLNQ